MVKAMLSAVLILITPLTFASNLGTDSASGGTVAGFTSSLFKTLPTYRVDQLIQLTTKKACFDSEFKPSSPYAMQGFWTTPGYYSVPQPGYYVVSAVIVLGAYFQAGYPNDLPYYYWIDAWADVGLPPVNPFKTADGTAGDFSDRRITRLFYSGDSPNQLVYFNNYNSNYNMNVTNYFSGASYFDVGDKIYFPRLWTSNGCIEIVGGVSYVQITLVHY